jgi:hypothetical protein
VAVDLQRASALLRAKVSKARAIGPLALLRARPPDRSERRSTVPAYTTTAPMAPWEHWFILGLLVYFVLHAVIRATGAAALEPDESELVILSQWWLPAYTNQPPLYVWLQSAAFRLLGLNLAALSILKNTLLFSAYCLTFLAARRLLPDARRAALATLSLLLIAQLAWEAQRDLSHSVIAVTMAAASLYALLRWLERPSTGAYLLVGLVFGLGLLSKYNYVLFGASALLVLLSTARGRMLLFDWRILLSLLVTTVVILPHLLWLLTDRELATGALHKLDFGQRGWPFSGIGSLAVAVLDFLAPWWLVMLLIFRRDFVRALGGSSCGDADFSLRRYLLFLFGLLLALALLGASHFKARWMLPLLLVVPLYVFAALDARALSRKRVRFYIAVCLAAAVLVLSTTAWRLYDWPIPAGRSALAEAHDKVAADAVEQGFRRGAIVAEPESLRLAGNLRLRFPDSWTLVAGVNPHAPVCTAGRDLLVVWDGDRQMEMPGLLRTLLVEGLGLDPGEIDAAFWTQTEPRVPRGEPGVLVIRDSLDLDCGS